jgi:hypothetical protein
MTSHFTANQMVDIMKRFPAFELSYETVSHKKVPDHYDLCIAIPQGKKAFLWFTFFRDQNVCLLMTLGRDKKVAQIEIVSTAIPCVLAYNTILYGSLWTPSSDESPFFVVEDMYFYKGIPLARIPVSEKLGCLHDFLTTHSMPSMSFLRIVLPAMWASNNGEQGIPKEWKDQIPYTIHHLQYRALSGLSSYLNEKYTDKIPQSFASILIQKSEVLEVLDYQPEYTPLPRFDYTKSQYKTRTIFEVKADLQYDIYHLYAYGKGSARVYCGVASIPNCKTSSFMNSIFRNIKENRNLDAIEESDDEDDFQNMRIDKYVDLKKTISMECHFQPKFKRWIPTKKANLSEKVVHIGKL